MTTISRIEFDALNVKVDQIVAILETQMRMQGELDAKMDGIATKMDGIATKMDDLAAKVDDLNGKVEGLTQAHGELRKAFDDHRH